MSRPLWLSRMRTGRCGELFSASSAAAVMDARGLAAAFLGVRSQGALGWEYKPFVPITGVNLGAFNANGSVSLPHVLAFARPRPEAVVGAASSWVFDASASSFQMSYTQVGAAGCVGSINVPNRCPLCSGSNKRDRVCRHNSVHAWPRLAPWGQLHCLLAASRRSHCPYVGATTARSCGPRRAPTVPLGLLAAIRGWGLAAHRQRHVIDVGRRPAPAGS